MIKVIGLLLALVSSTANANPQRLSGALECESVGAVSGNEGLTPAADMDFTLSLQTQDGHGVLKLVRGDGYQATLSVQTQVSFISSGYTSESFPVASIQPRSVVTGNGKVAFSAFLTQATLKGDTFVFEPANAFDVYLVINKDGTMIRSIGRVACSGELYK